jgi:hypothetical protein
MGLRRRQLRAPGDRAESCRFGFSRERGKHAKSDVDGPNAAALC